MLVNLTPDLVEIERRAEVAKEHNFEYTPQHDPQWSQGVGIYQCNFGFNFSDDEFLEKLDGWDYNAHLFTPTKEDWAERYVTPYGVADNVEQIKEFYKKQIEDPNEKWVIGLTPVFQELENKGKGGGWRWHKWGEYIGTLDSQCEYLDDEEFGEDFKYIICFHLYKVVADTKQK